MRRFLVLATILFGGYVGLVGTHLPLSTAPAVAASAAHTLLAQHPVPRPPCDGSPGPC